MIIITMFVGTKGICDYSHEVQLVPLTMWSFGQNNHEWHTQLQH